jgi:hypothetical protein
MHKKIFIILLIILASLLSQNFPYLAMAEETKFYVDPRRITGLDVGVTIEINITVSNVTDLYGWQFTLYYSNAVLNATEITEGPLLYTHPVKPVRTMWMVGEFNDNYNTTHGRIIAASTLVGVYNGVDGTGAVATIKFKTKLSGDSPLKLAETKLINSKPFENEIPHTAIDGIVHVGLRDVSITYIEAPKSIPTNTITRINVTAENQGETTQTFDVTLYYDDAPIETKTLLNMPGGGIERLTFTWEVTGIPIGEYTLKAVATQVPGEVDVADNTYVYGIVYIGIRDIAITNTIPSKTVTNDTTVYINVVIANNGQPDTPPQTFSVTVYYNITLIETKTVTNLTAGSTTTLTFTWDTTPIPKGSYRISAMTTTVPGETNTIDNTYTDGYVTETILGDVTADFKVDILDIATIAKAYGAQPGHPKWNPNADLDDNNKIDIIDIAKAAKNYGKEI